MADEDVPTQARQVLKSKPLVADSTVTRGVVIADRASKGFLTTTADFAPRRAKIR